MSGSLGCVSISEKSQVIFTKLTTLYITLRQSQDWVGEGGLGAALRGEGARADAARVADWRRTARAERLAAACRRALDAEPSIKGRMSCLGRRAGARV